MCIFCHLCCFVQGSVIFYFDTTLLIKLDTRTCLELPEGTPALESETCSSKYIPGSHGDTMVNQQQTATNRS